MSILLPKKHGVLGINARNLKYLKPFNPRKAVAFADDKLKTKVFLETRGIPVPKLYAKIVNREELRAFDFNTLPDRCVCKPNFGYGGEGILIMHGRELDGFKLAAGSHLSYGELFEHIEDVLDGMYSLNHRRDIAFFEQIIFSHGAFLPLHPAGLPDIRILVFNLVPVMAMLRLPTAESGGKANVHLGGIGLGIDLAKGTTTFGVRYNKRLRQLPNGKAVSGFKVPHWDELLLIASRIQQITNIGFIGVDLTLDEEEGPMLLEVNARAGLMVQIANLAPLGGRLERVEGLKVSSPEKGVRIAQDLFGEKIPTKSSTGKPVLATRETMEILGGRKTVSVPVILRPDHDRTVFDPSLIRELQELDALEEVEEGEGEEELALSFDAASEPRRIREGGKFRVKFQLGGKKLQTIVHPHPIQEEGVRASLGKRDLKDFLVDPGKKTVGPTLLHARVDLQRIDKQLADIDRKMQMLKHIRPLNLTEERMKVQSDPSHNPVFTYEELSFDAEEFLDRLSYLEANDSPLGQLLTKKREELVQKIELLQARGKNALFTDRSIALFGKVTPASAREARSLLQSRRQSAGGAETDTLSSEEVREIFVQSLSSYGLRDWRVIVRSASIADCSLGKKMVILRQGAFFSRERVESLIAHEIETHVLTAENGSRQPYELFERGCAGYIVTQEGLAVLNQNRVLSPDNEKRYWPALNLLAVHYGMSHSFAELRRYIRRLGFSDERAQRTCFKVKRGQRGTSGPGGFTKELVYFTGQKLVEEYLAARGSMGELYLGKINVQDIELVRGVQGIIDPVYLPKWIPTSSRAEE